MRGRLTEERLQEICESLREALSGYMLESEMPGELEQEIRALRADLKACHHVLACDAHMPCPGDGGEIHPPSCVICDLLVALEGRDKARDLLRRLVGWFDSLDEERPEEEELEPWPNWHDRGEPLLDEARKAVEGE